MTTLSNVKNYDSSRFFISNPFSNQVLSLLRRTFLISLLIGLIWLPGLPLKSALALPNLEVVMPETVASQLADSTANESDRMAALITCLPKQLTKPSFKQAWSEMRNDQLERAFNLKANPKLSEAETELARCMSSKGFTS